MISALILTLSLSFCPPSGSVIPDDTLQLVVGIAPSWDARTATIYRFERKPGKPWKRVGKKWAANLGKNGLAAGRGLIDWCGPDDGRKVEGDKKSPAGVFRLGSSYGWGKGLKNAPRGKMRPINRTMACVSDPASKSYNRIVDMEKVDQDWDWAGRLRRPRNEVKNRTIMIGVNGGAEPDADPPVPGEGSCILFHVKRGKRPTIGCTSLSEKEMDALVAWLSAKRKPVYVLMTAEQYEELRAEEGSGLPKLR
jgi:L,D-peptidoglycan transpeptidase YkuD (ErfK/YbiS/YcfS/YnhG family)